MKNIGLLILLVLTSCKKEPRYINIKDELIYKNKNDLFLKHTITLKSRNPEDSGKVTRLFNYVLYKDQVLELKDFIDLKSFHEVQNNNRDRFIISAYEDSRYRYLFKDHPASSPNILIQEK